MGYPVKSDVRVLCKLHRISQLMPSPAYPHYKREAIA